MTITEKILAAHADLHEVRPGEILAVRVDQSFTDDLGGPVTFDILERNRISKVFDPDRFLRANGYRALLRRRKRGHPQRPRG